MSAGMEAVFVTLSGQTESGDAMTVTHAPTVTPEPRTNTLWRGKRSCNGCGLVLGDVLSRDWAGPGRPPISPGSMLADVRGECPRCSRECVCCDDYGAGPSGMCKTCEATTAAEDAAYQAALGGGHETFTFTDGIGLGDCWGWECGACPEVHAPILSFAAAERLADAHNLKTRPAS